MADSTKQNQPFLRKRPMRVLILIPFLFFPIPFGAHAQDSTGSTLELFLQNDHVSIEFYNDKIFDNHIREHIKKGVIVGVEHRLRLWEDRRFADEMIVEKIIRIKIQYDHWENTYLIQTSRGDSCILTVLEPQSNCLFVNIPLIDTLNLEAEKLYFASVQSVLHPISLDNFNEINQWFQSEVTGLDPKKIKNVNQTGKSVSGWFLKMLMNVSGFRDKMSNIRTQKFSWQNSQLNWHEAH